MAGGLATWLLALTSGFVSSQLVKDSIGCHAASAGGWLSVPLPVEASTIPLFPFPLSQGVLWKMDFGTNRCLIRLYLQYQVELTPLCRTSPEPVLYRVHEKMTI